MNIGKLKERLLKIGNDLEFGIEGRKLFFDISDTDWKMDDLGIEYQKITDDLEEAKELILKTLAII